MNCKDKLESYLRDNGVSYQTQHHAATVTAQEVAQAEHVPGDLLAKVVMAFADDRMVMLVLPATYRVDWNQASVALGAGEVRLAKEEEFASTFPDCEVGAMPPFGNLYGLPVYVDQSLTRDEYIVCQAGTHTDTLSLKYSDYERLVRPNVAEFARHESGWGTMRKAA